MPDTVTCQRSFVLDFPVTSDYRRCSALRASHRLPDDAEFMVACVASDGYKLCDNEEQRAALPPGLFPENIHG